MTPELELDIWQAAVGMLMLAFLAAYVAWGAWK